MPTSLHSPHLPARREVQDVVGSCCSLRGRPTVGRLFFEACAGRRVRRLCLPAAVLFCRLLFACHPLPAMPTALHQFLPPFKFALPPFCSFCFVCPCFMSMCARITVCQGQQFASCKTVLLAAATRACSGGPCTGPFVDLFPFFLQSS